MVKIKTGAYKGASGQVMSAPLWDSARGQRVYKIVFDTGETRGWLWLTRDEFEYCELEYCEQEGE